MSGLPVRNLVRVGARIAALFNRALERSVREDELDEIHESHGMSEGLFRLFVRSVRRRADTGDCDDRNI